MGANRFMSDTTISPLSGTAAAFPLTAKGGSDRVVRREEDETLQSAAARPRLPPPPRQPLE